MILLKGKKLIGLIGIIAMVVLIVVGGLYLFQKQVLKEEPTLSVVSEKRDFKVNEDTEFKFKYLKAEAASAGSIEEDSVDYWEDINIDTEIKDPQGLLADIDAEISLENNGEFSVKFKKPQNLKPGVYTMKLKVEDESGGLKKVKEIDHEFRWGVLAINTNKSIYVVEADSSGLTHGDNAEVAYIQMGAVREDGHTICNANLVLSIKNNKPVASLPVIASQLRVSGEETVLSTEDGTIQYSGECGPNNITDVPDYFAYYQVEEIGKYEMRLTNLDTGYEITDYFEVREFVPFDIERIGPSRIYPPSVYEMVLKIKANQGFEGEIIETVPQGFDLSIQDTKYKILNTDDGEKQIIWQDVVLEQGDELELIYSFDAPDISPYLYLLGPLKFVPRSSASASESEPPSASFRALFEEQRKWQIASDSSNDMILFWDSTLDQPSGWDCISCDTGDPFYDKFPRGADGYGGTGGDSNHTHSPTLVLDPGPTDQTTNAYDSGAGRSVPSASHTHPSVTPGSMDGELVQPPYYELKMVSSTSPTAIASGTIAMFDDSNLPTDWATYTPAINYIIRAGSNASDTDAGGHTHSNVAFTVDANDDFATALQKNKTRENHDHTHSVSGETTESDNTLPPHIGVILAQAQIDTIIPDGIIAMFDTTPPTNWTEVAAINDSKFIQASTTYGVLAGSPTHSHPNEVFTTTPTGDTTASETDTSSPDAPPPVGHVHDIEVSFSDESNLPPYRDVIFAKYSAPKITVAGTVYSNEGVTTFDCDVSCTVTLKVNGDDACGGACSTVTSGGAYSISNILLYSPDDIITVFLDEESENAVTITKASSSDGYILDLDLYQNRVIVRDEGYPADASTTIADMAQYDFNDDSDIQFTATTTNGTATTTTIFAGNKLYIWPGKEFIPGGSVTVKGGDTGSNIDGDFHIAVGSKYTAASNSTTSVGGSWIASSTAVFTHNNSTTTFTATSSGKTIWLSDGNEFYNLEFDGLNGGWQFNLNSATATNDFYIKQGAVTSPSEMLYIGGSWYNAGTFTQNNGTTTFDSTDGGETIDPGESSFYNVDFDHGSGGWTFTSDATTTNNFFITQGEVIAPSGYLDIGNNFKNSGTFDHNSGIVRFFATDEGNTINPGGSDFSSLYFDGSGGGWEFIGTSATATNDFYIYQGTVTSTPEMLYVGGSWYVGASGTFLHDNATTTFDSTDGGETIDPGESSFYNVEFNHGSGGWTFISDATTTNNFFITQGTVTAYTGYLDVGNNFLNAGTFTHNDGTVRFYATDEGNTITTGGTSNPFYNVKFDGVGGGWTFDKTTNHDVDHDFIILQGTVTSTAYQHMLFVGGSWYNSGTFNATTGLVLFDSSDTGETINPGNSSFFDVYFSNGSGGWTITNDATSTRLWRIMDASSFTVNSNVRIEVNWYMIGDNMPSITTWSTNSVLYFNSASGYALSDYKVGSKTQDAEEYDTLEIGANTDIRMWNSHATTTTVDPSGSLYSMDYDTDGDGAVNDGYLYIWGDYHTSTTDWWSYEMDFDGTAGANRQVNVRLAANSTTTIGAGETLEIRGDSANTSTTINRQGGSGNYAIRTEEGATVNFQYYQIRNINSYGLNLTASTTVTSLNYGDFLLELGGATMITVSSSTIDQNAELTINGSEFSSSTGAAVELGYNVTATGTATSYWWFTNSIGNYDGEDYDLDPGGDPGYIRWDDSATTTLTQWYHRWYENIDQINPVNPLAATNTEVTNATSGTVFRLRVNIQVSGAQMDAGSRKFILQYASATDCVDVLEQDWTEIGGLAADYTSVWRGYDNGAVDDGDTITSLRLVGKSDVLESYDETSPSVDNPNVILIGQAGEWDWVLQYNAAYSSRTYCFRMARANGNPLDYYYNDIYPKIVTYQAATWKADEDTNVSAATNTDIRLRFQLINTGDAIATDYKYQIEYALRTDDTCGDETFTPMPILGENPEPFFEMTTSSFFRYQDPTTHQLSGTSTYPFNTGQLVETYATTGDMDVGDVSLSEAEYVFHIGTSTSEGYYCFRLTNDGTVLDNYNVYGVLYIGTVGVDISGTIYPNEGGTPYNCESPALTVWAKVNGAGSYEGICTESDGTYSIETLTASAGDVITVFLHEETEKAVAVTKAIDGNTSISGLDLYEDRVILRSDNGVALTIENMAQYDNSTDTDIQFTATTTNGTATTTTIFSGNKLYIWTDDSFSPGGEVKVLANADGEPSGSLHIGTGANFTACSPSTCTEGSDITVSGSWIASSSATFTHNDGTVTFKATATDKIIWIEGSSDFYQLEFDGLDGEWTFQDNATSTATTTITNGKVIQGANSHLTFGGLYIETTGAFFEDTAGSGTLTFDRTADSDPAVIDDVAGTTGLGDVYIGLSPGVVNQNSDIVVDSFTVNVGDIHNTRGYEIDATSSITIYGTLNASDTKENDLTNIFLQTDWTNTGTFTHGNSTTTFDGATENNTIAPGDSDFYSIVFDGSGGGWEFTSNSATATHNFFILQGTATSSSEMLYIGGSWKVESGGTFLHNNATTTFNSADTGETINPGSSSFYNVDFDNTNGGWTITNDATSTKNWFLTNAAVSDGFIVDSSVRIEVKGQFYTELPGTETTWNSNSLLYLNSGTNYTANLKTVGDIYESLQIGVNTDIRMWNSYASTYNVDSSGSLYSMDHDEAGDGTADNGKLFIWGDYHVTSGNTDYWSYEMDFDGTAGANRDAYVRLAANSSTTLDSGGTLNATGTAAATTTIDRQESGNYGLKVEGGILNMEYYEIRNTNSYGLKLTGSPTITSLNYGDYGLSVEGGTMMTVEAAVIDANEEETITGCSFSTTTDLNVAYNVTETGTPSSYWTFNAHYGNLDGEDYDNDPGDPPGYIRWDDSGIIVSGIIYSNEGVSAFDCAGDNLTVKIELNGAGDYIDTCDGAGGTYSMTIPVGAANDVLTAFIDGHGSFRAVTITKASSSDDNITGLDLYQNRVIVKHEDAPADPITIADMAYYDANDDTDIKFTATTTDGTATTTTIFAGNKLYIWPNRTFNASGSIAILGNAGGEPDGSLHIAQGATLTACPASDCSAGNEITVAGSWIASSSATFTHNNATTTFTATTTGKNIWTEGSSDFYDIVFNGSGGEWTFKSVSATTTHNFTITQGTVTSTSGILYVGGNWDNSGTFDHNSGTVLFDATDENNTISDGGSPFYLINFNGSGGTWLYQDGASVSPATTTVQNGTSTFLNAKTGSVDVTGGYLLVDWYLGAHLIDASNTATNIDTDNCDDITITEGSASSTVWGYIEGVGWDGSYNSTTTGTGVSCGGASGINPQPGSTTAIRIREYKKTATETFYYKYNLKVEWQTNYGEYDYYDDYGDNYLTSVSSTQSSGVDKVIGESWYRTSSSTINSPYTCSAGSGNQCINQPPDNGSWYVGMRPGLLFEIVSGLSVDFGELNSSNNWTAKASSTLEVTTSASNGYVVTAWAINEARMRLGNFDIYISKYNTKNDSPKEWDDDEYCYDYPNCCGFGFTTDDSNLSGGTADRFTSGSGTTCAEAGASGNEAYSGFATSTETVAFNPVADLSNPTTTDRTIITYKISVDSAQAAGQYQTTVIYICTANY